LVGTPDNVKLGKDILEMLWEKIQRKQDVTTQEIDAAIRFMNKKSNNNKSQEDTPLPQSS